MAFHREPGQDLVPVSSRPVQCPNCSNVVPAANVNVSALLAKCDLCGHVIQLADLNRPRDSIEDRPGGIVEESVPGSDISMSFSWFDTGYVALLLFCIMWDGFVLLMFVAFFFGDKRPEGIAWLAAFGFFAVGCGLTYVALAGLLNQTFISVAGGNLVVRHRPVRWLGECSLQTCELVGFDLDPVTTDEGLDLKIKANHRNGRQTIIVSSRPERQAKYISQKLAAHLQLPLHRNYVECERFSHFSFKEAFERLRRKSERPVDNRKTRHHGADQQAVAGE